MKSLTENIKLIIGLGNPAKEYQGTYHNIGHLFINTVSQRLNSAAGKLKLEKSKNFMNESGRFVKSQIRKHKISPENLLIVHDDADIELGKIKWSFGRGSAGHKGIQDIIDQLKTKSFWRLRIGIRPPDQATQHRLKASDFVLKRIPPVNQRVLEKIFREAIAKIIPSI